MRVVFEGDKEFEQKISLWGVSGHFIKLTVCTVEYQESKDRGCCMLYRLPICDF